MIAPRHRESLVEGSGIDPRLVEEGGVESIASGRQLPAGFSSRQRRLGPGMLFEVPRPNGETAYSFRPDAPDKPGRKYEQPSKHYGGPGNVLYVHPSQRHLVADTSVPAVFTEGAKKVLSILTAARRAGVEVLVVGISGVWNFLSDGELIPDMLEIPVVGREVGILFDSDVLTNPDVQRAAVRLAETQIGRGAAVRIAYLPDGPDGAKTGADDFLVSGKSYAELRMTMRPYDPADFEIVKMSRDDKLRARYEDLERRHADTAWTWPGADADEDLFLALAGAARKHGKIHADGIRVRVSWGTLGLEAKIGSSRTVGKGLGRLEERGLIYKDNEGRKEGKAGAFVLVAGVKQVGGPPAKEGKSLRGCDRSTLHPQSPRLWASRPKSKPTKRMIREHRLGTRSLLPEPREGLKRLGKKRSHILDRLDAAGGALALDALGELMGARPYDLTRRKTSPKGRDGLLVWLERAGIIAIEGGVVALTSDWLGRLEEQRELGEEIAAGEQAEKNRKIKSAGYREYLAERRRGRPAASKPTAAGLAAVERSHRARSSGLAAMQERAAAAAKSEEQRRAEAFVLDKLRALGRIRLELLQDVWRDAGGDRLTIPPAVEALGCRVERLAEHEHERFVFPPAEQGAA